MAASVTHLAPPSKDKLKTKHVFLLFLQILFLSFLTIPFGLLELVKLIFPSAKKSLENQVVLVTGAGRGLGKGLALGFAREGCKVAVADIHRSNAEQTVAEIIEAGGVAKVSDGTVQDGLAYTANVADKREVVELQKSISLDLGPVDVLVNNAGVVTTPGLLGDHTEDHVKTVIDVNLISHFWMVQEFLPAMRKRNCGHIVAIASMASYNGFVNGSAYVTTKFGVRGFMEVLREELDSSPDNHIKTTTVFPYFINTSADYMRDWDLRIAALSVEEVVQDTISAVRENQELITIPKYMGFFVKFKPFLPKYVSDLSKRVVFTRVRAQTSPESTDSRTQASNQETLTNTIPQDTASIV